DQQVRSLAVQALDQAVALLAPRRALIDALVETLIEQETIEGDDFRRQVEAWEAEHPGLPVALSADPVSDSTPVDLSPARH
ncbi:MAG: hypothetical protein ACKOBY_06940, partial [Cyanobium sp.]